MNKYEEEIQRMLKPDYKMGEHEINDLEKDLLEKSNSTFPIHDFFNDIILNANKGFDKNSALKDLKIIYLNFKNLEYKNKELKLYKKAFGICCNAVDIDTPKNANYECIFAYDAFPLTSNKKEVAIVKKALELLNEEESENEI